VIDGRAERGVARPAALARWVACSRYAQKVAKANQLSLDRQAQKPLNQLSTKLLDCAESVPEWMRQTLHEDVEARHNQSCLRSLLACREGATGLATPVRFAVPPNLLAPGRVAANVQCLVSSIPQLRSEQVQAEDRIDLRPHMRARSSSHSPLGARPASEFGNTSKTQEGQREMY